MARWSSWRKLEGPDDLNALTGRYGVYRIRVVKRTGKPIPIQRMGECDDQGLIYFGQGNLKNRVGGFWNWNTKGSDYYWRMWKHLEEKYPGHRLEFSGSQRDVHAMQKSERSALNQYLKTFWELPPCNSSMPREQME